MRRSLAALLALVAAAVATESTSKAATLSLGSGYDVLAVPSGARVGAMGESGLLLASGAGAALHNPALLAGDSEARVSLSHAQWFQTANHNSIAYAQGFRRGVLAAAVNLFDHGSYEGRDEAGVLVPGRRRASEATVRTAYAENLSRRTKVGLAATLAAESLAGGLSVSALALDAGATIQPWEGHEGDRVRRPVRLAAAVRSLGQAKAGGRMPVTLSLGAAYDWPQAKKDSRAGQAALSAEIHLALSGWARASFGGEYWLFDRAAIRGGYRWNHQGEPYDSYSGFSIGIGTLLGRYALDYAYAPYGDLGATHRFTLELPL